MSPLKTHDAFKTILREFARNRFTGQQGVEWHTLLTGLGIRAEPVLHLGQGTCELSILETPTKLVVENVLFWNLNGLRARWKSSKLPLQEVIRKQQPDVVVRPTADFQTQGF